MEQQIQPLQSVPIETKKDSKVEPLVLKPQEIAPENKPVSGQTIILKSIQSVVQTAPANVNDTTVSYVTAPTTINLMANDSGKTYVIQGDTIFNLPIPSIGFFFRFIVGIVGSRITLQPDAASSIYGRTGAGGTLTTSGLTGELITVRAFDTIYWEIIEEHGNIPLGVNEYTTRTGAGAVDVIVPVTYIASTGANALTLADGIDGQWKTLLMTVDAGDATLTPTNAWFTNIVFDDVNDTAVLRFLNGKWAFLGGTATVTGSSYYSDEKAQDAIGGILTDTATIDFNYDDATPQITASIKTDSVDNTFLANMAQGLIKGRAAAAGTGDPTDLTAAQVKTILALVAADISDFNEAAEDAVGGILTNTTSIDFTYNDGANTITADIKSTFATSGKYTPTRSAESNLDSNVTPSECQYLRVGNTVTVSGRFTADPTLTATATSFELTLPIASNIGAAEDVAGVAFCGTVAGQGAEIIGVAANDTAKIQWISGDVASQTWSFTFSYQVI